MTDLPPPGFVRALSYEEMSPAQRELYGPRRYTPLPQCRTEYDLLQAYDDLIPSCHREKPE